ncbi:MAG: aminotransferase class I/II-fold pyridoxal phosphate-dependent enzyme [Pyrinomonadaceae bacterium]|nr:aminotransferase class I/II-fold pyridoxal phosphate-dependent enzyme [Phycisphaerales bacterium]
MPSGPVIDLRSDTVTRPTPAMRQAMAQAVVGDDVLGDDPTVIRLQERIAQIMGKEAACFVPSGTMANQTALRAQTEHGDGIVAHRDSHIFLYETGGPAALSGCLGQMIDGHRGVFDVDQFLPHVKPNSIHFAKTSLLVIENTHNRGGGSVWPIEQIRRVTSKAREMEIRCHLDGARIWNACAATGIEPAEYAKHFDTVSCCFSKGLGAPVGYAVCGDAKTITRVARFRKMFGGAMRQSGILAAAALYALDNHRTRLVQDHEGAKRLAQGLSGLPNLSVAADEVDTNMVFFDVAASFMTAADFCKKLDQQGVRMLPTTPQRVRAVVHLDIAPEMIGEAIDVIRGVVG